MKKLFLSFGFLLSLILTLTCCAKVTQPTTPQLSDANDLYHSTVALVDESLFGGYKTYCSGVWIGPRRIITARHCIDDGSEEENLKPGKLITFTTYREYVEDFPEGGPREVFFAVVVASDLESDLALLATVDDTPHKYVKVSTSKITPGQEVAIIGHPSGIGFTYIKGVISQERHMRMQPIMRYDADMLHITALIWGGNSGGGAFNAQGELVGIAAFMRKDVPGMSFFIHRNEIIKFLENENYLD